jgi:predicted metal-dependent hydrolase
MDATGNPQAGPPGAGAHPGAGAAGGCHEPPPALLIKGIGEFNEARYWECHEMLEELWRAEPRPVRDLYQGILQIGVGFHHLRKGNYSGAVKVLNRGLTRLQDLPEVCQGVQVAELTDAARTIYERILALGPDRMGEFDVAGLPHVRVGPADEVKN